MRYIGTKTDILAKIEDLIKDKKLDKHGYVLFDAFSGTAAVGEFFKDKFSIIANDIQYYSYVLTRAKLNTPKNNFQKLGLDPFKFFNDIGQKSEGFIYKNYSLGGSNRTYFSEQNASKIDFIRQKIEEWKINKMLEDDEYYYLIASLIESVSKVANVAGVYGSYLKTWDPRALKEMKFIPVETSKTHSKAQAKVYNQRIEDLIKDITGDILYLDPPYTSTQYSGQYHILETIAKYDNPTIFGKGGLRDGSQTSSSWSRKGEVEIAFEKTIANAKFKYIIMSYSTDGIMSEKFIENVLKRYGLSETFEIRRIPYKKYINYHSKKQDSKHHELLFYIEKKLDKDVNFESPLNYQGGKNDLIEFIKKNLPNQQINKFIDVFAGGFNVGINVQANEIVYNEFNNKALELIRYFKETKSEDILKFLYKSINKYGLTKGNKEAYNKLRNYYNSKKLIDREPKLLYLLILYGFHQQLRFNSSLEFNNPIGNSSFNESILEKLVSFTRVIKEKNVIFNVGDFESTLKYLDKSTFYYFDPPYLITLGSYNDGKRGFNGWNENDEKRLYKFIDLLNAKGINFMLSNLIVHKERKNKILQEWLNRNNYKIIEYKGKGGRGRKEILIVNY